VLVSHLAFTSPPHIYLVSLFSIVVYMCMLLSASELPLPASKSHTSPGGGGHMSRALLHCAMLWTRVRHPV
jgi:hypothetical protein